MDDNKEREMNTTVPVRTLPKNFVEHLSRLAVERPYDTALVVVGAKDGASTDTAISYALLDQRVRALAARLQRRFATGERVLLLLDNDERYVVAFFACLYAGLIAVPAFPPESARPQHLARLTGMAQDAQARCLLTTGAVLSLLGTAIDGFPGCEAIDVDAVEAEEGADPWRPHTPHDADIAFLQYTSGSTSTPKGVMVSHANLMANERAIEEGLSVGADDVFVTWLPLYHDMGLIGGLLQPLHRGIPVVLMTPQFFLERPIRWLEAIARHRGSISGGPDFAYRLCLERIKDGPLAQLDLSSWRVAFSGAEPVRHDTLRSFIERFVPTGFGADAVYPCYGLAEATLLVSGGRRGQGLLTTSFDSEALGQGRAQPDPEGSTLVSCGRAPSGHRAAIVDAQTLTVLGDDRVGEIWASGPSIAQGYWQRQADSEQTFVERDGRRWLRTGDLGFVHKGELFITGRLKDLIILRGQNVYPQDLERAIEAEVEAARPGRVAAFAVALPDGGEGVGIAMEISRGLQKRVPVEALVEALSQATAGVCREPVSVVVLLNPGGLPKTSSGKLQRAACRLGWERATLDAYALYEHGQVLRGGRANHPRASVEPPLDALEADLATLWQQVLKRPGAVAREAHFFAAGGNSLAAVQLAARISTRWAIEFPVRHLFEQPRFGELAQQLRPLIAPGARRPAAVIPVLPAERRTQALPLSHAQQRQWFLWQLDPTSTAYHVSIALRLSGTLDVAALRAAVDALIERHEPLRTVFRPSADGTPQQLIQPARPFGLATIDVLEAEAAAHAQRIRCEPFDLTQGRLLRVALLRIGEAQHQLVVVMHHIVSDGASMQLFVDELAAGYIAHLKSEPVGGVAPRIQYADHAVWQRDWLAAGEAQRQLAWWRAQLGHDDPADPPVLALSTDHPRRPQADYRAARHAFELPTELRAALQARTQSDGATLSMALLAGFQALLHRYTGQPDVRVGVPIANRRRAETAGLIGFFVNTLVLRNPLHGRLSLAQVLAQARQAALGAQAHQDLPFEQLVEALQPERSLSHSPMFQVMFNHVTEDSRALAQLPGLTVDEIMLPPLAAQFELTLEARERPDGPVALALVYAAELFDPPTMERLAAHYLTLLRALAEQPDRALGDIDLLDAREHRQLAQWGVDERRSADLPPVHRQIEQRARATPNATALIFAEQTLSCAELNRRANRLAHRLIALGVGPETRVGVAIERSLEMVVGLLAILKAGGAYVPLDPDYPIERLAYMVGDSGIALLLTHSPLRELVAGLGPLTTLELDTLALVDLPEHDPQVELHGENLAYVIYTSGSTGQPKGAAIRHRALSSCMAWMQESYQLSDADTVLHKAPFGFDVSVWEMFWPLTVGVRLVVAEPGAQRDPARLAALIRRHRITTLNFVPSMLQAFLQQPGTDSCTPLRRVVVGGEALSAEAQKEVAQRLPQAVLYNLYGPTETTIHVTHWTCRNDGASLIPIGRPITDTTARVLDADLNLVPIGVAGELYLGGVSLARGYLNRAGLVAERFVADPFDDGSAAHGGRLYRTGDLVRWNREGQLDYLGRIDHQVKVRGFRIELGEVEAQLLAQPEVRDAVVVAQPGPGGMRLVGYVVALEQHKLDAPALRRRLAQALPDYMVPSAIMTLDALPLNPNGKVERKALPAPSFESEQAFVVPQGTVAETLAAIWCELLGVAKVGLNDNFFDLGGHSLLLIRAHRLLQDRLRADVQLIDLFKYPTLGSLAQWLEHGPAGAAPAAAGDERARRQRAALLQRRQAAERTH